MWLSEEEEEELNRLLSEGFRSWRKADLHAFVQACVDFGPTAYAQIADVVGKSEADVRAYSAVFWKRGP